MVRYRLQAMLVAVYLFLFMFIVAVSANKSFAGPKVNPGEWTYTMKMKIEGLGVPVPVVPVTFTDCQTRTDASPIETQEMKKAGCKILDEKIVGNLVTYTGRCTQGDSVTDTHYKLIFQSDSMDGTFDQVRKVSGKVQSTATGTFTGKRIGPCKAK